jgi:hypothetical protein
MREQFNWRWLQCHEAELAYRVHAEAIVDQSFGLVRPDDLSHFIAHTGTSGAIIGCFTLKGMMVAYGVLGTNSATHSHLASLLSIEQKDRGRFAILDGVAALPNWRGNGLHRESIRLRRVQALSLGRNLIGATVAPDNILSLRGLLAEQFRVREFAMLYGGMTRLILECDVSVVESQWIHVRSVDLNNQIAHTAALSQGLIGYACSQTDSQIWQLHYGRQNLPVSPAGGSSL